MGLVKGLFLYVHGFLVIHFHLLNLLLLLIFKYEIFSLIRQVLFNFLYGTNPFNNLFDLIDFNINLFNLLFFNMIQLIFFSYHSCKTVLIRPKSCRLVKISIVNRLLLPMRWQIFNIAGYPKRYLLIIGFLI